MNEYELYHHGVKGIKWGVRKKHSTSDNVSGKSSKKPSMSSASSKKSSKKSKATKEFVSEYRQERHRQQRHIAAKRSVKLGADFVNGYLSANNYTVNGKPLRINNDVKAITNYLLDRKYMKDTFK